MKNYKRKGKYFDTGGTVDFSKLQKVNGIQLPTPDIKLNLPNIGSLDLSKIPVTTVTSPSGLSSLAKGGISAAGNLVGSIGGNLIGGGLQSSAGNAISSIGGSVGGAISTFNPVVGGIVSAASGLVGGLTNRMFGSNINDAKVKDIQSTNKALVNTRIDDSSNESILNQFANQDWGTSFTKGDIGEDGWFSNEAERTYQRLKNERSRALANVQANYGNAINNASSAQNFATKSVMFKNGGNMFSNGSTWNTGVSYINNGGTHEQNPNGGVQIGVDEQGTPNLLEEGEVVWNDYVFSNRLKPSNKEKKALNIKGKKAMTYADAAKKIQKESEERPNDSISKRGKDAMLSRLSSMQEDKRKREEASKFKKQLNKLSPEELMALQEQLSQGNMMQEGNPQGFAFGGLMGNMFDGTGNKPNTLNSYGFVPDMNLGWFNNDGNYTDDYRNYVQNTNLAGLQRMMNNQYSYWNNSANKGTDRWNSINKFYTTNPIYNNANYQVTDKDLENYKRLALDGKPGYMHNMTINSMSSPSKNPKRYIIEDAAGNVLDTFSNREELMRHSPYVDDPYRESDTDGYHNYHIRDLDTSSLINSGDVSGNGEVKGKEDKSKSGSYREEPEIKNGPTWLRYAPVLGAAIGLGQGLLSKPDYSNADAILEAANDVGSFNPVSYDPLGNYLTYKPFDRDYYINKLNALSGATRRSLINQSAGNRAAAMAGILASDYNAMGRLGDLARQAEEYNLAQREKVEEFNRKTDMFNSEAALKTGIANQEARLKARSARLNGVAQAAGMREAIDNARGATIATNLTNLFDSLGNIGMDAYNRADRDRLLNSDVYGTLASKPQGWSDELWEAYKKKHGVSSSNSTKNKNEGKKGGYLTIKKKGGKNA